MLSLDVLFVWCGAHVAARCRDAAASRPAEAGAPSPCEAQGGAAEGRVSACVLWCAGAVRQWSSCCAAAVRAPRSPDACAACDDAKGREPKARALRGQEGAGGRADATRADRSCVHTVALAVVVVVRRLFIFFAKVSFLRRKTNNTQAPGLDTPRCVTLGGLYTAAESFVWLLRLIC